MYVPHIDEHCQADIVDMQSFESDNKGYSYILAVTDIFLKYALAIAIKSRNVTKYRMSSRPI